MSTKPKLILVVGHRESGKDMAANKIAELLATRHQAMSRLLVLDLMDSIMVNGMVTHKTKPEHRKLFQAWGSIRREEDPDYWIKKHIKWIKEELQFNPSKNIILTGCRYPREIAQFTLDILEMDIVTIRIIKSTQVVDKSIDRHASEVEVNNIPFDYWFYNNDSIPGLYHAISNCYQATGFAPIPCKLLVSSRAVQFNEVAFRDSIDRIRGQSYTDWQRGRDNTMADTSEGEDSVD